jgi:hypothetical protein
VASIRIARRPRWLGLLAVAALSLFSIQPLLTARVLCSDDGVFHVYKALGLELLIRRGYWFPRWSPDMAHGFGYPLYNFYAPLGSYILVGLHSLGLIYPAALHVGLALCLFGSAVLVYVLVRRWWGDAAGIPAAAVYGTAPYLAFDALFRGAFAETLAWVWPPLILWALDNALRSATEPEGRARMLGWGALAAAGYGALVLTHNAIALVTTPLLAGYVLLLAWNERSLRALATGAGALAAGLGLSAYFWLPALAERTLVQTDRLLVPPIFTYYTNFISAGDLLAAPRMADPLLINSSPPKALGLVAALLALAGLAALIRGRIRHSAHAWRIVFFAAALAGYALLTLPVSRPLWDVLPLLPFVQFPWRMLMPAALCASVLAGAAVWGWTTALGSRGLGPRRAWLATGVVSVAAIFGHLSWWYPRYCGPFVEQTLGRMLQYEYDTFTVGTSAKGEFLPKTVHVLPDDDSLARALEAGETPQRVSGVPEGAALTIQSDDPLRFEFTVDAPQPFALTYLMFDYLGWRASVDGQPAAIQATPDTGLIRLDVPAGQHSVSIWFGSTPLRTAAGAISILAVLGLVGTLAVGMRARESSASRPPAPALAFWRHAPLLLAEVFVLLFAIKALWIDRTNNPLHGSHYDGGSLDVGTPLQGRLQGGLDLLAYQHPAQVQAGGEFDAVLYLAAPEGGVTEEYRPKFTVAGPDGSVWNDPKNALPPRWQFEPPPTYAWPPGEYAQWARHDMVLPGTPPGRYRLVATVFDLQTLVPLSLLDANGEALTPEIDLGEIEVTRPDRPARQDELNIQYSSGQTFSAGLTLLGYNLDREEARPGDTVLVTLFWRADRKPGGDLLAQLSLDDGGGPPLLLTSFSPAADSYPTSQWQAGDVWRGQHFVRLPPDLPNGHFSWRLAVGGDAANLGSLAVSAPVRAYTAPAFDAESGATFGDFAELTGYSLTPATPAAGQEVTVTLVWHALATPAASYSGFIHVADATGRVVAQSDAVPANWTRPTTGWLPGEFIVDPRIIVLPNDLPPGNYSLLAGLADLETGARAAAAGPGAQPDDRALIGTVTVSP